MNGEAGFSYDAAFGINSGILSPAEQEKLRQARVLVMGMSAGGVIAVMLARTGVTRFTLIDHSRYALPDINRDAGCYMDNIGEFKAEVIKSQLLRINPQADVRAVTQKLVLEDLVKYLDECDVFFAQSDDIAMSVHAIMLAQQKQKMAITVMPSGMTAYVEVFPPGQKRVIDPAALFGSPTGLSYRALRSFLRNPLNRCGRRWHITEGKWRLDWFKKWRDGKEIEAQLCPALWLGASLAVMEAVKYITGRWQQVAAPRMWHPVTAQNRVGVERFRRRSWLFERFIYWSFGISWLGIGRKYQRYTAGRLRRELDYMERQEKAGRKIKLPLIWHWI